MANNPRQKEVSSDEKLEQYKITLEFLRFEATTLWSIFSAYMVAQTIFLGCIANVLATKNSYEINFVILLLAGIIGIVISVLWLLTFHGNSAWYYFRMKHQAKPAEDRYVKSIRDNKWYLLNKKAERVSVGMKNKGAGYVMIGIFIFAYSIIALWSFIKLCCNY
jgi:hypothetical protein